MAETETELDDETLIERSRTGDAVAVRTLVARHLDAVYRIAYRMVGARAQAEDIAQDVLLRMLSYRAGWFSKASFHVWLRRAVVNRAIDAHRKQRPWLFSDIADVAEPVDRRAGQDDAMVQSHAERKIAAAVLGLPPRQRAAVNLCFYEDMSLADAATALGTSVGAVESLLHRAKLALRESLDDLDELRPVKDPVSGRAIGVRTRPL